MRGGLQQLPSMLRVRASAVWRAMCFVCLPACIRMCSVGLHLIAGVETRTKGAGRSGPGSGTMLQVVQVFGALVVSRIAGGEVRREPPR